MKKLFNFFLMVSLCSSLLAQTQWPFPNPNQQGRVAGTIGEFRQTYRDGIPEPPRFHRGTDLRADDNNPTSLEVRAINSGSGAQITSMRGYREYNEEQVLNGWRTSVTIAGILYDHINPTDEIFNGTTTVVNVGDVIGEMVTAANFPAHLHLQTNNVNYLSQLTPYVDHHIPTFDSTYLQTYGGVEFYKNGIVKTTTNQANYLLNDREEIDGQEYLMLYDKIDIAAHIKDERTSTTGQGDGGNTSPYLIALEILNQSEVEVFDQEIRYDGTPVNANALYCFHPDSYSRAPYRSINILTADPYETDAAQRDQFINTRLAIGQTENFSFGNARDENLDAKINAESSFPDGIYYVDIGGCDLDQNGLTNNCMDDKRVSVVIDNFKPYIESVKMSYSTDDNSYTTGYEGNWDWSNDQLTYVQIGGGGFLPSDFIQIAIQSSEPLSTESGYQPSISIAYVDDPVLIGNSSDHKTFVFSIPPGTFQNDGSDDGRYTLEINAYDITRNQITGFDQLDNSITANELPIKNTYGNWPAEALISKTDIRHGFTLGSGCTNLPGGRVLAGDCNPLIADFGHSLSPAEPRDVQFTDLSSPSEEITSWSWDFGDGSTPSATQNPMHSYDYYGDYVVTLTASRGSEQDSRTQTITISDEPLQARFAATPNTGSVPFNVQLDARNSIGNIVNYQWNISPSTGYSYISSNENSRIATISINQSGNYDISLEVSDNSNTHTSDIITISAGNGAEPIVDFDAPGSIYNGIAVQFFENTNVNCVNNLVFEWTFEGGSPATSSDENPWVEFSEAGNKTVELCVTDGCGVRKCYSENLTVTDPNLLNSGVYAEFIAVWPTSENYFNVFDVNEEVNFLDKSFALGKTIHEWHWWFELPLDQGLCDQHYGTNSRYFNEKKDTVKHTFDTPGKYLTRFYVFAERSNSLCTDIEDTNYWDEIIIIRRPTSFCEEETLLTNQDVNANETLSEIAGILNTGSGNSGVPDFNAKGSSNVTLQGSRIHLRAGTHLQSGSRVHITPKDCDDLRETF